MQTSFIIMNSNVCDEKIDCSDLAVGRAQADRKSHIEKFFISRKEVRRPYDFGSLYDRLTLQN